MQSVGTRNKTPSAIYLQAIITNAVKKTHGLVFRIPVKTK